MRISDEVKRFFATRDRTNILATSDKEGRVNVAAFGSPALLGEDAMSMMLGDNRTYANLRENGFGAFLVIMHGTTGMGMQGCRLYVSVKSVEDSGDRFDKRMAEIRERIGGAADMLKHYVEFDVIEARPILDFGQGI